MDKLGLILEKKRPKVLNEIIKANAMEMAIKAAWPEVFKGRMGADLSFGYVRDKHLAIYSSNPCWVNELGFHKTVILDKLNGLIRKRTKISTLSVQFKKAKGIVKKAPKSSGSLQDKIIAKNRWRKEQGFRLCVGCKKRWVKELQCLICKQMDL